LPAPPPGGADSASSARAPTAQDAPHLLEISQAHIDGCTYIGPGGLAFAEELVKLGGQVAVPTTLNSNSVDRERWRALGVAPSLGEPAHALGSAYLELGATLSFTCAPYLLDTAPGFGEQVAWGESNAVVFANSVLGARTQKYADYLDICAALVGRVPAAGPHLDHERVATVQLDAGALLETLEPACGDAFWPALGYLVGLHSDGGVPVVTGLEASTPTRDDLKASPPPLAAPH
jgi:predicted aconitase